MGRSIKQLQRSTVSLINYATPKNYINKSVFLWKGPPYKNNTFCLEYFMAQAQRKVLEHTLHNHLRP